MEALLADLRYAVRTLRRSPGFTAAAVLTLALGIGAATAGFGLLNWVLIRPLPGVRDAGRLGLVWFAARTPGGGYQPNGLTLVQRKAVLQASPAVTALAGRQPTRLNLAAAGQSPRRTWAEFVTTDYFETLGVPLQRGRAFVSDDDALPLGLPVTVISDLLWHEVFGGRADVVGQRLLVNGVSFTVIGVAAPGFHGPDRFNQPDLWLPGQTEWDARHLSPARRPRARDYIEFVLRLRRGATFDEAASELKSAVRMIALADTSEFSPEVTANLFPTIGLPAMGRDPIRHQLALVMGVAGLVLLVTCANVANLLLFRRAQRRGDIVLRLVLGASRGRLIRHLLTESAVVGVLSAVGGVLIALWLEGLFRNLRLLRFLSLEELSIDWRVLTFSVGAGLCAALVAGVLPALLSSRGDLGTEVRAAGPTQAGGAPLLRTGLAALQVAISLTLVAGAYLFARTLQSYAKVPLGFDPAGVTIFQVDPTIQGYTPQQAHAYLRSLAERVTGIPGVEHVAFVSIPPFTGISNMERIRRADAPANAEPLNVVSDVVSGDYFAALRIPVLRGTVFKATDAWPANPPAVGEVVLSESCARRLFGDRDPVGAPIELPRFRQTLHAQVVGVVGDVHWNDRRGDVALMLYEPLGQSSTPYEPMIAVRARTPSVSLTRQVQDMGRALDVSLPIEARGPLSETVAKSVSAENVLFNLLSLLSTLALILTAVGVYALVAYGVTTRTREFGIRMALGAETPAIVGTAMRPAGGIALAGIVGGVVGALVLTRFIAASLYGVSRFDPAAFVTAAAVLAVAVFLASYLPARRAAKVDPMVALRYE
jgi:predicted permease